MHRIAALLLCAVFAVAVTTTPAPRPRPAKGTSPRPLEATFDDIRRGMAAKDLIALMAPYQKVFTGHYQWQCWTDGPFEVVVTIWPDGDLLEGILAGRPYRVQEKVLYKRVVNETEKRLVPVRDGSS